MLTSIAWDLPLGNCRLGSAAWQLPLGICHLGFAVWQLPLASLPRRSSPEFTLFGLHRHYFGGISEVENNP